MVHYSLFMVLCLNVMLFRVSRRSRTRDARARTYVFVRFRTVQYSTIVQYEYKQDIEV